jgi:hypothetical protein
MDRKYSTRADSDYDFNLDVVKGWSHAQICAAILADVRRELKQVNANLAANAAATTEMIKVLRGIRKNTYKRRHKKKVA